MNKIPPKLRLKLSRSAYMKKCARESKECKGRITWEHALTYKGRQIQEEWAIVPLCVHHHLGKGLEKEKNRQIAFSRATTEDLEKYPKLYVHYSAMIDKCVNK